MTPLRWGGTEGSGVGLGWGHAPSAGDLPPPPPVVVVGSAHLGRGVAWEGGGGVTLGVEPGRGCGLGWECVQGLGGS